MFSHSVLYNSATPWTVAHQAPLSMGILQARILEWVAMPSSRGSSQPRDQIQVSHIAGRFFTVWATRRSDSAHLCIEEINTLLPEADTSRRCFARLKTLFNFTSSLPLPLYSAFWLLFLIASLSLWCYKKTPSIQVPIRWLLWGFTIFSVSWLSK